MCIIIRRRGVVFQVCSVYACNSVHISYSEYPINKNELFNALKNVGYWKGLCDTLKVRDALMNELQHSPMPDIEKKHDCLTDYFNNQNPDWRTVVKVVANYPINDRREACNIAVKHMKQNKQYCKDEL